VTKCRLALFQEPRRLCGGTRQKQNGRRLGHAALLL
jgi:hypothetical protein